MNEKASDFDEFLIATILADLFDPTGSENLEFVSKKIVDGLMENGFLQVDDNYLERLRKILTILDRKTPPLVKLLCFGKDYHPKIKKISCKKFFGKSYPSNTSMNLRKFKKI